MEMSVVKYCCFSMFNHSTCIQLTEITLKLQKYETLSSKNACQLCYSPSTDYLHTKQFYLDHLDLSILLQQKMTSSLNENPINKCVLSADGIYVYISNNSLLWILSIFPAIWNNENSRLTLSSSSSIFSK